MCVNVGCPLQQAASRAPSSSEFFNACIEPRLGRQQAASLPACAGDTLSGKTGCGQRRGYQQRRCQVSGRAPSRPSRAVQDSRTNPTPPMRCQPSWRASFYQNRTVLQCMGTVTRPGTLIISAIPAQHLNSSIPKNLSLIQMFPRNPQEITFVAAEFQEGGCFFAGLLLS